MTPSPFFETALDRVRATRALGPVLDLACGRGRHALACCEAGLPTVGLDRSDERLRALVAAHRERQQRAALAPLLGARADLETEPELPVQPSSCGTILVFYFLFRPLAAPIARALAPGGLLVYETFTRDQRALGWGPRSEAFLLAPDELRALFDGVAGVEVVEYAEGRVEGPKPRHTARLLARRSG